MSNTYPLKVGSAPAAPGFDNSAWRLSPLRKPSKGLMLDSDRKFGVLHRIDSQMGEFHSSNSIAIQTRCPSCRLHCQLLCSNCVSNLLRLGRIRDVNHELYLRKAELCQKIDTELQLKMNFQSDVHVCARSIQNYKQKIEEKKRSIDQLHRTLALLDVRIAKNQKNVHTLRGAYSRHTKIIDENKEINKKLRDRLNEFQEENGRYSRFFTVLLDQYYPLKKIERTQKNNDSMTESSIEIATPKVWPPVKKYYFTMNGCEINENSQYDHLKSELIEGSPLMLSKRARLSFAALLYLTQLINSMAYLIDFNLPYKTPLQELATTNRWTSNLFSTDVFRLNSNVMAVCAAFKLTNDVLCVQNPFNNLFIFKQLLRENKITTNKDLLTEQMKHKIVAEFKKITYEERQQEFNLEHVEEDWVSINFATA